MSKESNQSKLQKLNKTLNIHKALFLMTFLMSCPLLFWDAVLAQTNLSAEWVHSLAGARYILIFVLLAMVIQILVITKLFRVKKYLEQEGN